MRIKYHNIIPIKLIRVGKACIGVVWMALVGNMTLRASAEL